MSDPAPTTSTGPPGIERVRFATFDVDLRAGELRKGGVKIKLYGQPFSVLAILLERPGQVVTREELQQKLWARDTFVDFEHGLNKAINKVREALGDDADNPRFIETLPRRGYRFIGSLEGVSTGTALAPKTATPLSGKQPSAIDSLAVLPLENASGDPEMDYLSDGIAETLINSLAQLRRTRVVPRTLAFQYRVSGVQSLRAGRELGVRAVLVGRIVQRGEDLTVSVELVDVDRQSQLWGGRYNRKMTDLVALQEELATQIAEKLRLQLTGEEKKRLRKRPTHSNEAFRLVLQAQPYISAQSPDGLRRGVALCQKAIEIDPTYAAAHAHMSMGYSLLHLLGYAATSEVYPAATAAAKKALELDDSLADAHASLGAALFFQSWDFGGAERELRRALELNPDSHDGFRILSWVQLALGRFDEAITSGKRAVELAPLDYLSSDALGTTYLHVREFDKAIEQLRKTVDIDPGSHVARGPLAWAYAAAGQRDKAIEECELGLALSRRNAYAILHAAVVYAVLGEAGKARKLVEEIEENWTAGGTTAFWLASAHACLDEKDAALEWLEKAFQELSPFLAWLKIMHHLERLHGDPRFKALVKRIGIPD